MLEVGERARPADVAAPAAPLMLRAKLSLRAALPWDLLVPTRAVYFLITVSYSLKFSSHPALTEAAHPSDPESHLKPCALL